VPLTTAKMGEAIRDRLEAGDPVGALQRSFD
jgi:hypothetical protein